MHLSANPQILLCSCLSSFCFDSNCSLSIFMFYLLIQTFLPSNIGHDILLLLAFVRTFCFVQNAFNLDYSTCTLKFDLLQCFTSCELCKHVPSSFSNHEWPGKKGKRCNRLLPNISKDLHPSHSFCRYVDCPESLPCIT